MDRLREFLETTKVAWVIALLFFATGIFFSWAIYRNDTNWSQKRESLFCAFQRESTPKLSSASKEYEFVESARKIFLPTKKLPLRIQAYNVFYDSQFSVYRDLFLSLSPEVKSILLIQSGSEEINLLIEKERTYRKERRDQFQWFGGWYQTIFVVWQITSVLCLLWGWWRESYVIVFFPFREWWFWIYSLLAFPWSMAIWMVGLFSFLRRNSGHTTSYARRSQDDAEYEKCCQKLSSRRLEITVKWEALFPQEYSRQRVSKLKQMLPEIRTRLDDAALALEKLQAEYFHAKSELDTLAQCGDGNSPHIQELKAAWNKERDDILKIPHVRAVDVDNDRIWVYTDSFLRTATGGVGPFVIKINPISRDFEALKGHNSVLRNSTGIRDRSSFCFGNMYETIRDQVKEYKLASAVKMMMHSFQTNASE